MKAMHVCFVAMAIAFTACSEERKPNASEVGGNEAYRMPDDLLASKQELKLSELADSVWYVPLETTPPCILAEKFDHFRYKNNTFYIMDDYSQTVHVFSDKGKFLNRIGHKGGGPSEFNCCLQMVVNNKNLYILDMPNRIKVYDLNGDWKKNIKLSKQPYRLLALDDDKLACYISDDQFPQKENSYSWLILDAEGDSLTCINTNAWRENKTMQNYWVANEFSSQYPMTYKEAYNDSLYYFPSGSLQPVPYASVHPGVHRMVPEMTWEEVKKATHALRISYIYDTPSFLLFQYKCLCHEEDEHLGAFRKKTGEFFNVQNKHGERKITNDMGGPDFIPLACVYPNLLVGLAEADACPDEFARKHQVKEDDNQILVMIKSFGCR